MDGKNVKLIATLKEAKSEKSGKDYVYLSVQITPNVEKKIFLEPSEVELIRLSYK